MTLRQLSELSVHYQASVYPAVPAHAHAKTTYSDTTANGLAKCIVDFCKYMNHFDGVAVVAMRTGNEGRYRPGQVITNVLGQQKQLAGQWLPGMNNGMSDTQITLNGRVYYVEIKIGKDRQSDAQKKFAEQVTRGGAVYQIVKSWPEFYKFFESITADAQ